MEKEYSVSELIKTFEKHAEQSKEHQKELKEKYLENFPNQDLPDHFNYDFEISLALQSICIEIQNIKDWIHDHEL